jgi:hypothetical protein
MQPTPSPQDSPARADTPRAGEVSTTGTRPTWDVFAPHERIRCKNDCYYPCGCDGQTYSLDDVRVLTAEFPRAAQRRILAFGLSLPPELVSDFWRVAWTINAATLDTEREEDALSALCNLIAAGEPPAGEASHAD